MKPNNLRLIGISLAVLACWWCASVKTPLPSAASVLVAPSQVTPESPGPSQPNPGLPHSHLN